MELHYSNPFKRRKQNTRVPLWLAAGKLAGQQPLHIQQNTCGTITVTQKATAEVTPSDADKSKLVVCLTPSFIRANVGCIICTEIVRAVFTDTSIYCSIYAHRNMNFTLKAVSYIGFTPTALFSISSTLHYICHVSNYIQLAGGQLTSFLHKKRVLLIRNIF
jgi:hypothetical protein